MDSRPNNDSPSSSFLVTVGIAIGSISDGFIFGQMSGMIDKLHSNHSSIPISDEFVSWIAPFASFVTASTINITCFVGFAVVAVITEMWGRRYSVTVMSMPALISWILTYFAQDKYVLLLTRVLAGLSYGGILFLSYTNIGEYMTPSFRFLAFNMLVCVGSMTGTMMGHVLSVIMNWRNVALIGILPTMLSAAIPLFWVESPMWLASKGRFEESEKAFRALHSSNENSDKELKNLIAMETDKQLKYSRGGISSTSYFKKIFITIRQRYFWKLYSLSIVVNVYRVAAGRVLFSTLAITMLQDISGTSDILTFTLLTNGFSIFGATISFIFMRKYKMRQLLFPTGILANLLLVSLGLLLLIRPEKDVITNWAKILLLALYLVTVAAGPYPVLEALLTEINPLEVKSFCLITLGILIGVIQFLAVKLAPGMFISIGYHGVFFLNAAIVFICLLYLWFYMPETKGRSLQEIEVYFKNNKYDDNAFKFEQSKELLELKKDVA
ncbi:unnamed protein product [Leptidea sinapis]|uniref:Major facilitator superfamily (MFS) profile domain-containing protein n=1 Tax=Leptidea sinapis TaxID=189913 RepID=A0A5E4QW23_9NEOP|nr:unnamed protein product [Leptidea sinapis]